MLRKVCALQAREPEFDLQNPHLKEKEYENDTKVLSKMSLFWAYKMAHWVRPLTAKPDGVSSNHGGRREPIP